MGGGLPIGAVKLAANRQDRDRRAGTGGTPCCKFPINRRYVLEGNGLGYSLMARVSTVAVLEPSAEPGKDAHCADAIMAAVAENNRKLVPKRLGTGSVHLDGFHRNRQSKDQLGSTRT